MATNIQQTLSNEQIQRRNFNIEQRIRDAVATLPTEEASNLDVSKILEQITESFYAYESHVIDYVYDRDMHYVIYSLGFVPSPNEINQLIYEMLYRPQIHSSERGENNSEHHLIHLTDYADVIIPKLLHKEYKAADEQYLLKCFEKLDQNKKNNLHKKLFVQTISSMEDILDKNESEDLLSFLMKNQSLTIENRPDFFDYKRYIKHLLPQRHSIYLDLDVAK